MNKELRIKGKGKKRSASTRQGGQAMLLTVMLLSSAILGATSLAALLVLFQLRQATDAKASTQAIFAADSGIECVLFERIVGTQNYANCGEGSQVDLDNGSFYTVIVDTTGGGTVVKSVGRAGRTTRALEITF